MLRLNKPVHTFENSIDDCGAGISANQPLKTKLSNAKASLIQVGEQYLSAAQAGDLSSIRAFLGGDSEVVMANMTKSDFVRVYEQYFVPEVKFARRIYDAIMNSAAERCPFCGGIGTPRNLDHFLPKAFFPQFSVLPINLVPACRDCNMDGKGSRIAFIEEDQPIQPYLDAEKFFDVQWIFAVYRPNANAAGGYFRYYASPPDDWSVAEKNRVVRHFERFDIAKRYSVKAAEQLATVIGQIERMMHMGLSSDDVRHALLEPGMDLAPFINDWRRGMYQALIWHYTDTVTGP